MRAFASRGPDISTENKSVSLPQTRPALYQLGTSLALPAHPHQKGVHQPGKSLRAFFIGQVPRPRQLNQLRLIKAAPQSLGRLQGYGPIPVSPEQQGWEPPHVLESKLQLAHVIKPCFEDAKHVRDGARNAQGVDVLSQGAVP